VTRLWIHNLELFVLRNNISFLNFIVLWWDLNDKSDKKNIQLKSYIDLKYVKLSSIRKLINNSYLTDNQNNQKLIIYLPTRFLN